MLNVNIIIVLTVGGLILLHPARVARVSATSVSVESLNVLNTLDNPCNMDLRGQPLSVAYNIEQATYLPTVFLNEIARANSTINHIQDTTNELQLCVPIMSERLITFPDAPNFQGKTTQEILHLLHRELIYILAHFHFARHDFDLFQDHCNIHFPGSFGGKIDRSIGRFRNVLCNMMTRVGYSPEVQQNLRDVLQVSHNSGMDCSQRRDWTCVLLSSTRQALGHLYALLQGEGQSRKKKTLLTWNSLRMTKRTKSWKHPFYILDLHKHLSKSNLVDSMWANNVD